MIDRDLHLAIGRRVKHIRTSENVSQKQLADAIGISQTHMSNMENGVVGFTVDNIVKLSEFFKCDIRCFFDDKLSSRHRIEMVDLPANLITDKKILVNCEDFAGVFNVDSEALDKILRILEILKK